MARRLIIVRGSSGSGKSYLAKSIQAMNASLGSGSVILETDQYWTKERPYSRSLVEEAHSWNRARVESTMREHRHDEEFSVIIPNTLPLMAYIFPYLRMCREYDFTPQLITVQRPLAECVRENSWNDMPTGQIRGQIKAMEHQSLDTMMMLEARRMTEDYCYDCDHDPCICNVNQGERNVSRPDQSTESPR